MLFLLFSLAISGKIELCVHKKSFEFDYFDSHPKKIHDDPFFNRYYYIFLDCDSYRNSFEIEKSEFQKTKNSSFSQPVVIQCEEKKMNCISLSDKKYFSLSKNESIFHISAVSDTFFRKNILFDFQLSFFYPEGFLKLRKSGGNHDFYHLTIPSAFEQLKSAFIKSHKNIKNYFFYKKFKIDSELFILLNNFYTSHYQVENYFQNPIKLNNYLKKMYSDIHEMHSNYYKDKCELIVRDLNLTSSGLLQNFDINNIKIFYSLCSPFLSPAKIKTKRGIQEKIKKHFWVCDSDVSECQGFGNSTSSIIFSLNKKNPKILQIRFNGSEVNFNLVFDENLKKVDSLHFDKNSLNITIHLNSDDNKVASGQIEQNSIQRNLLLNEKKKGKDEKKEENEKRKGQNDRINGENNKKKEEIVLKDEYSTSDETLDESVCESDFDNFSTTKEVENESQPSESLDFAYQNEDISDSSEIETHLSQISLETIETQTKSEQDYETNSFSNDLFPTNSLDFENGSNSDETEKTDDTSNTEIESSTSETETFQATLSPSENFTFYPLIPETAPYEVVNDFFLTYLIYVNDTHYIFVSEFEIYDENTISNLSVKVPQYNVDYPMIFRASFSNKLVGPPQINDNFVYPYVLDNTSTIWCCWKPDPEILDKDYCHQIADYRYGFYVLPSIPDLESSIMISIKGLYNTSTLINLFCDDEQAIKEANYYVNESAIEYSLDIYTPASCPHKFVEDFIPTYQPTPTMSQQLGTRLHFSVPYTNKTMLVFDLDKAETALDNLMLFVDETGKIENTRVTCGLSAVVGCPETKTCSIYTFSNIWKCGKTECIPIGDFRYGLNFTACLEEFIQNYEDETDFSGMEIILTYSGGANGITTMVHLFCNYNFDNIQFDMHGVHFTNGTYQISGVSQYACPMVLPYSPASSFTYFSNTPGSNGNSNLSNPNNTYLAIGIIAGIIVIIVAAILVTHFATRKTDHREVVEDSSDLLDDSEQSQAEQL